MDNIKKYKRINTPFGYFGSKNKIAFQICDELPPHSCWIEAFCGSAALTLAKPPAPMEIINDIDKQIVNFFEQLRKNEKELCRLVALTPYAREELNIARNGDKRVDNLEKARRFLVEAMMSINGVFGESPGGFSYSQSYSRDGREARVNRWFNLPDRISKVAERLKNVRIENKNAIELLKMFQNRPATLIYLDPPYLVERTNGYNNEANCNDFHHKLLKLANKSKCMILISGYTNPLYEEFLTKDKGWSFRSIITHTKDSLGRSHSRIEILWMNKQYQKALASNKIPIRLTKDEKKQKKINPERL